MSLYVSLVNLSLICLSFFAALLLFQYGFLLKRSEIRSRSDCSDVTYTRGACWLPAQYKHVILVVIDALRYDFAALPSYSQHSGHLPIISELLSSNNESAMLAHFLADPPTTTMQRLKGLTTGSLPTFLDVASNFASSEIMEDNWVEQIHRTGRNITFLGDDTWVSLFPSQFHRSFDVPSFDINDINGVDDAILEHLYEEIGRSDWDVLIAHFLGVDHCGHKYGPDHPELIRKLKQMDEMIRGIVSLLDNETLFVILGDHGMTETGDHGGDAQLELDAALFMYSHKKLLHSAPPYAVPQVDLVPTLSLLLDSPIPFSNIGVVIESLIPPELRSLALSSNVWQMSRYAHLMVSEVPDLYLVLRDFEAEEESDHRNLELMRKLQQLFRISWTHFSIPFMRLGLESIIEAMFGVFDAYFDTGKALPGWIIFRSALFFMQISVYLTGNDTTNLLALLETVLVSSLIFHSINLFNRLLSGSFPSRYTLVLFLVIAHAFSFLSNSYIVFESSASRFLAQTVVVVAFITEIIRNPSFRRRYSVSHALRQRIFDRERFGILVILLVLLRCGKLFERCREEQQFACSATLFSQPLSKLQGGYEKVIRFLLGVVFMTSSAIFSKKTVRNFSVYYSLFVFPTTVAIIASWMTQLLPETAAERFSNFSLFSSQIVYALVIWCLINVCVISFCRDLHTLYGSSISFMICLSQYFFLLLGDSLSISYIIFVSIILWITNTIHDESMLLIIYVMLASYGFFSLSHQATFSSIPWQAGFVGVEGNFFIQAVPATLIISHLFSSHIIVTAALPYGLAKNLDINFFGCTNGLLRRSLFFLFLHAFRVLCVCVSALVHRRHLMVWKIFAPKFVFESVGFLVICLVLIFVNCVFRNLNVITTLKK